MEKKLIRIAVVGHYTYFENHFPEGWRKDPNILCIDVNEGDYSWLLAVYNFRPQLTLFFRPELYPRRYIESIPGLRVAILSEPIPDLVDGELVLTSETRLRLRVYSNMAWDAYHWRIFYDKGKKASAEKLAFPIDEYRPLPIDTESFCPPVSLKDRIYDVSFIGKPTPHRISKLDFLRSSSLKFLWVAHGLSGNNLAAIFKRSKVVVNVHADGVKAFEPRIYLAAACAAGVFSEPLSSKPEYFLYGIAENNQEWNTQVLKDFIENIYAGIDVRSVAQDCAALSTRRLIEEVWSRCSSYI